jgi:hypothetical protein
LNAQEQHDRIARAREPATGFDFDAVEDPTSIAQEDLIRIAYRRHVPIIVTRELADVVLEWGSEKALGPGEHLLEQCATWIMSSRDPNDLPFRAACFARVFGGPGARNALPLRRIARLFDKEMGWVDTTCRNLKATLMGGKAWWPSGKELREGRR